ncbi:double-strand break repair protein AddB [Afifella sp. IM 167]|uniref:double-strand break repair protein AddB n=1 Tax=Afifella sp. IM 167 TaxID=2033586 RepID=UPI001CCC630A|nr:double-strand break repair protein AddB [Afifella sp. IM 167]MBZ8133611.1 double-strand break repair protein AddB [Afifella sp. IM 167]
MSEIGDRPNVFSLPAGTPFLEALVEAILSGRLVPQARLEDPLALAGLTLYLPTRRAARAIRESFLKARPGGLILPKIRTLGDLDEDEPLAEIAGEDDLLSRPVVAPLARRLILTRLVLAWSGTMVRQAAGLGDEPSLIPASPADAARLAGALGDVLDEVGLDPARWQALHAVPPEDLARYWQITREFLEIVSRAWPGHLEERGLADPGAHRDTALRAEAARLSAEGSHGPVIAAGSTGSVPATAALLAAIARLPNGAAVLPGLDTHLDQEGWEAIGDARAEPADAGHPQFGLKKLLAALGCRREEVRELAAAPAPLAARMRLVSDALRPAATTDHWAEAPAPGGEGGLEGIALIEAQDEREEALTAALILRRAVEEEKLAALITPDRALARRVSAMLERWQVRVDDSGGMALTLTAPGVLARLVAEVAWNGAEAIPLLALAKHPLARFGWPEGRVRRAARALERAVLRGPVLAEGLPAIETTLAHRRAAHDAREDRNAASRGLSSEEWDEAAALLARLQNALSPMLAIRSGERPLAELLSAHAAALAAIAEGPAEADAEGTDELFAGEAGEALAERLDALFEAASDGPALRREDYPALFETLAGEAKVRRRGGNDPRVHIWGTLEARLQSVDVAVLGGLNEGVWPRPSRTDPFLSRLMAGAIGLDPPERRLGLSAHDFVQSLGHRDVFLTRAMRQEGEPMVASRWLQRLAARAGSEATRALRDRGAEMLALARALDVPQETVSISPPMPCPPLEARPKQLSVTRIETLIRDPYAIHAEYVLGLKPFEEIAAPAGAAERGMLVHDILETFVAERPAGPFDEAAHSRLIEIGRDAFAGFSDWPEVAAIWWPRFQRVARWFVRQEAAREGIVRRHVEARGAWEASRDFRLTGRADRIDILEDGRLAIIDYKTGTPPSAREVLSVSPQLPLEALMARRGAFAGAPAGDAAELLYYQIHGRGEGGKVEARGTKRATKNEPEVTLAECLAMTEKNLFELIAHFASPENAYLSSRVPRTADYGGDFDHLARIAEFSLGESEE